MVWNKSRIVVEIKMATSAIYGIRMHTTHDYWTEEQIKLIVRIEHDLVRLNQTLK